MRSGGGNQLVRIHRAGDNLWAAFVVDDLCGRQFILRGSKTRAHHQYSENNPAFEQLALLHVIVYHKIVVITRLDIWVTIVHFNCNPVVLILKLRVRWMRDRLVEQSRVVDRP